MLLTFSIKKWSIAITIIVMTFLIVCISVFVTRYFDKKLCIKRNNVSTAKSLTLKPVTNAGKTTDTENDKKKQEINSDVKKNDDKNISFDKNINVMKNDVSGNISQNNEKQVTNEDKNVAEKKEQNVIASGEDKTADMKLQKSKEGVKNVPIIRIKKVYTDDKVATKNDIIVNIHIVKEKKDKNKKTNKVSKSLVLNKKNGNRNKQVIKKRSSEKKQTIKKNEVTLKQKIVKNSNDEQKIEEKNATNTNNITLQENKNDKTMPKVIQEVAKPERQKSEGTGNNSQQADNVDDTENSEIYNTIIIGE